MKGELHLALVTSSRAHAKIIRVDYELALKSPGAVDYIDRNDIPGKNFVQEEYVIAYGEVKNE